MIRYAPSPNYMFAGLVALAMFGFSAWCATRWIVSAVPAALFLISAAVLCFLALRPAIEVHPGHLRIGRRLIAWDRVRAVTLTSWTAPLLVRLTLDDGSRVLLVYPGEVESAKDLVRRLRRMANEAVVGREPAAGAGRRSRLPDESPACAAPQARKPRYPLLREEDEAEVERLFQRLKTVGHLDPKTGSEEN